MGANFLCSVVGGDVDGGRGAKRAGVFPVCGMASALGVTADSFAPSGESRAPAWSLSAGLCSVSWRGCLGRGLKTGLFFFVPSERDSGKTFIKRRHLSISIPVSNETASIYLVTALCNSNG